MATVSKKFVFTLLGILAIFVVSGFWLVQRVWDIGLWGLWFAALNGIVGVYSAANVVQKRDRSKNYHPELDK